MRINMRCRERFLRASTLVAIATAFVLVLSAAPPFAASETVVNPLAPPDTSSPRATLKSFRESMEAAWRPYYESVEVPLPRRDANIVRAIRTLDYGHLPPAQAPRLAAEAAVQLNEVLDRVELPPYEEIPDAQEIEERSAGGPAVWRIPNTGIEIVEIESGRRRGEFLFSAETVDRIGEFYERAKALPPQPGAMAGLAELISYAPGAHISRVWIERLPERAKEPFLGQALWKWIAVVVVLALYVLALYVGHLLSRPVDGVRRYWRRFAMAIGAMALTYFLRYVIAAEILIVGGAYYIIDTGIVIAFFLLGAVALLNLGPAIGQTIIASRRIDPKKIDANLISLCCITISWLLVVVLVSFGASRLGVPIEAVIASLGVGGFAFALAARPTLENLIAGVTLYLDKPVRIGDFCQFGDIIGSVEQIGLRSTRIRQWGGYQMTVPNSQFADFQLVNYSNMQYVLFRGDFGVRLDTTPDQLRYCLAKLREMMFAHPMVNWPRVRLTGFGDSSLNIQLLGYVDTIDWGEYHAVREDIYLRTLDIIKDAGTRLAVPVQMTYLAREAAADESQAKAAEMQVDEWRKAGELPFPDMSAEQRESLSKTLDYPPKGSIASQASPALSDQSEDRMPPELDEVADAEAAKS